MKVILATSSAAVLVWTASAAVASQPAATSPHVSAVVACRGQADAQARLRCYDAAVAALATATATGAVVVVSRNDVRKARRSLFGLSLPNLSLFGGDADDGEKLDEITAKIKSVRDLGHGRWQLDLDTDGIWRTTEPISNGKVPRPGETVEIKRGTLGSYFLRIGNARSTMGLRVR